MRMMNKNPFAKMDPKAAKSLLDDKAQKIEEKALNVTIVDLYFLDLIDRERDKLKEGGK